MNHIQARTLKKARQEESKMKVIEIVTEKSIQPYVNRTIDFLRKELKLTPSQCYVLLKVLFEEFPKENIPKEVKQ